MPDQSGLVAAQLGPYLVSFFAPFQLGNDSSIQWNVLTQTICGYFRILDNVGHHAQIK